MSDQLPSGWTLKPLAEIADVVSGGTPGRDVEEYWQPGEIEWVTPTDITRGNSRTLESAKEKISKKGLSNSPAKLLPINTVLMTSRATLGEMKVSIVECCTNQGFKSLIPNSETDVWFLYYQMKRKKPSYEALGIGSTFLEVNKKDTDSFVIEVPPVKQQQKIAKILTTVDNLIEKTQALIDKYTAIKQGMMTDLFTRGIDLSGTADTSRNYGELRPSYEQAPELYKETELGWVPKEWEVVLLDEYATRGSGHTPSKSSSEYWDGGVKWVSLADSSKLDNLYIDKTDKEISELGLANSSATKHPEGTVILSRDAGIGKSAILGEVMAVSQHFMAWRCGSNADRFFLYFWLQYMKSEFEGIAMGSTIPTIGLNYFKRLKIEVPIAVEEQMVIGKRLLSLHENIATYSLELSKYKKVKTGLMQDLLTGKVKVS